MPAIPLRAMVLCANPGRLLRYGALFNRCGYFRLSLCLDRRELRRSWTRVTRTTIASTTDSGWTRAARARWRCWDAAAASGASCWWANSIAAKRLLFEWSRGHGLSIGAVSDRPLGQVALAALIKRDRGCPDLLRGIA